MEVVLRALNSHNRCWKWFMARTLILVLQAKCGARPKIVWADICLEYEEVVQTFLGWTILLWTSALYHYEPFFFLYICLVCLGRPSWTSLELVLQHTIRIHNLLTEI